MACLSLLLIYKGLTVSRRLTNLDVVDLLLMLFEAVDHGLAELTDPPDPDLALLTTGDDSGAVRG